MPAVLVFREELLAPSETFVAAQATTLERFQPLLCGLRRVEPTLPLTLPLLLLARSRVTRALVQSVGWAPGLRKRLLAAQPVLAHVHFAIDAAVLLPLLQRLRLPIVVTLHGYDVMRSDAAHRASRRGRLYLRRREALWAQASTFLCVSDAIRLRAQERGFPEAKLQVLPIGVAVGRVPYLEQLTRRPQVLFVGRLVEKKGCDVLLRAMQLLQQELPDAALVVVGDGPERRSLEALACELGVRATFVGVQTPDQVQGHMRASRCLAAPSLTARDGDAEGLPTVLAEALAMGLPVASTTHSGIPELLGSGVHGLLSPERDSAKLAENLLILCGEEEQCNRLRVSGRARVEEDFDLQKQSRKLEQVYDRVAGSQGLRPQETPGAASQGFRPQGTPGAASQGLQMQETPGAASQGLRPQGPPGAPSQGLQAGQDAREARGSEKSPRAATSWSEGEKRSPGFLRQTAWLLSGNAFALVFQTLYFLVTGRMLGAAEYGAFAGAVALVNVLAQFSSCGMEMVLLRTVARSPEAFPECWGRALVVTGGGFLCVLLAVLFYGRWFLPPELFALLPFLALSDALFGKVTQLGSRALQGAELARWSAKLLLLTNLARAIAAGFLFAVAARGHTHVPVLRWTETYLAASFLVAVLAVGLVSRKLGLPRWSPVRRGHLVEGLSFACSSSAISVYNDVDKTLLATYGMLGDAGIYAAAYRVVDVASTPIVSLFAAGSPELFRRGKLDGAGGAALAAKALLRWAAPFGLVCVPLLAFAAAPAVPLLFGRSFAGSVSVLRFLAVLPLFRALHYAFGTAITACDRQWLRTGAQGGAAVLNLVLNLVWIPAYGWRGAAVASLCADGGLALATFLLLQVLLLRPEAGTPHAIPRRAKRWRHAPGR